MFEGLWSIKRKSIGRTTPGAGHPGSRWQSPLFQEGFRVEVQNPKQTGRKKTNQRQKRNKSEQRPEVVFQKREK